MPTFDYEALDSSGMRRMGSVEALDRGSALQTLDRMGLRPFSVGAEGGVSAGAPIPEPRSVVGAEQDLPVTGTIRLNRQQLVFFTEELADMLLAGVRLEAALALLEKRARVKPIRDVAGHLRSNIRNGSSFSAALAAASPSFGSLYCNLAAAGEAGGSLGTILQRQGLYLSKMAELRGKVLVSLIYPAFLAVSGVVVVVLFLTFLLPRLVVLLESSGGTMPAGAAFLLGAAEVLRESWWLILLIILSLGAAVVLFVRGSEEAQRAWDRIQLKIPVFGRVLQARFHVQFLETMGNLLGSGVNLLQALQLSQAATANRHHQERLGLVVDQVREGQPLSEELERADVFPGQLVDLVRVGEETGDLDHSMKRAALRYDRELDRRIEGISALVQPAIILVMAAVVGSIAYLMVSIIYDTVHTIRKR